MIRVEIGGENPRWPPKKRIYNSFQVIGHKIIKLNVKHKARMARRPIVNTKVSKNFVKLEIKQEHSYRSGTR